MMKKGSSIIAQKGRADNEASMTLSIISIFIRKSAMGQPRRELVLPFPLVSIVNKEVNQQSKDL
jgi:hypothetical protein